MKLDSAAAIIALDEECSEDLVGVICSHFALEAPAEFVISRDMYPWQKPVDAALMLYFSKNVSRAYCFSLDLGFYVLDYHRRVDLPLLRLR